MLVLHYTGMRSAEAALSRLCDPAAKVSAHYTIDRDGVVYAHVAEGRRAWHAGVSYWAGATDINARSIGIEIVNPGHEFGYVPFAEAQIESVIALSKEIVARHKISARRVVGHSDIAPARKEDPGELFPWKRLAAMDVGAWPMLPPQEQGDWKEGLVRFGYGLPPQADVPVEKVVMAFQRHFRPKLINGVWDGDCDQILWSLLTETPPG
jgi:N-acetylmuramoyl-L-alanine amidase